MNHYSIIDKEKIDFDYLDYKNDGLWRSYHLTAEGNTLAQLLENAEISEIASDGEVLDRYSLFECSGKKREAALSIIEREIINTCKRNEE